MQTVAVLDYGMSNLRSVAKAVAHVGGNCRVSVTDRPEDVRRADRLIFPGQGAIGECMLNLRRLGLREAVVEKLRLMGVGGGVVMDGRDIGTKVFPEAQVKLFLEADPGVRARRRWIEERGRGREATIEQISSELEERDRRDRGRAATPLIRADDAILLDTSDLDIDRVVGRVLEIVEMRS